MKTIGRCAITRNEDVDRLRFDWGRVHLLSEERVTGATSFSFGHVELETGRGHDRHNHPTADEIIFVLSGSGDQMLDDRAPVPIAPGDCIWIPRGVYHATVNRGPEPMTVLVVYCPAGAEQSLRSDPAVRIEPAGAEG